MFARVLCFYVAMCCFFFFQAEDGIRDVAVTGVQTCALPIYSNLLPVRKPDRTFGAKNALIVNRVDSLGHRVASKDIISSTRRDRLRDALCCSMRAFCIPSCRAAC